MNKEESPAAAHGTGENTDRPKNTAQAQDEQAARIAKRLFEEFRGREDIYAVAKGS